jgi:hypothetical protein
MSLEMTPVSGVRHPRLTAPEAQLMAGRQNSVAYLWNKIIILSRKDSSQTWKLIQRK